MDLFVGLDVALEETSLCIIDKDGKMVRETKVDTEPAAIRSALEGYADRLGRIGIEASSIGMWLHRGTVRGGRQPAAAGQKVVRAESVGHEDRQAIEHDVRHRGGRAQARRDLASDVDRRHGLPVDGGCEDHAGDAIEARAVSKYEWETIVFV